MAVQNPTSNFNWDLPVPGASVGVWGQMLNAILGDDVDGIDAILASMLPKAGGDMTGTINLIEGAGLQVSGTNVITSNRTLTNVNINASLVNAGTLNADRLPTIPASKVGDLPASKITSGSLGVDRIPDLPASKITSGAFSADRIPGLPTSKITSGTFAVTRGGTGRGSLTSGAIITGAGASAVGMLSPGTAGAYVYSDGSSWVRRKITVSTSAPSGTPADGDIWFRY